MANDVMTLHCETADRSDALQASIIASLRDVTKLRGEVLFVAAGSLPNDGKVIDDTRRYE
jgi:phenylacetate-CoA ligase